MPATDNTAKPNNNESLVKFTTMQFTKNMMKDEMTVYIKKLKSRLSSS